MRTVGRRRVVVAMVFGLLGALVAIALDSAIAYLRRDWSNPVGIVLVAGVAAFSGVLPLLGGNHSSPAPPQPSGAPTSARNRRRAKRFPVVGGVLVMLLLCGGGVAAATYGTRYLGGWVTGDEGGVDALPAEAVGTAGDLTLTVHGVTLTRHFTKVEMSAANAGENSIRLPVIGNCVLIPDGDHQTLDADSIRSRGHWTDQVPAGRTVHGTVIFGRLPDGVRTISISFTTIFGPGGGDSITVADIPLN